MYLMRSQVLKVEIWDVWKIEPYSCPLVFFYTNKKRPVGYSHCENRFQLRVSVSKFFFRLKVFRVKEISCLYFLHSGIRCCHSRGFIFLGYLFEVSLPFFLHSVLLIFSFTYIKVKIFLILIPWQVLKFSRIRFCSLKN